MKIKQNKMYVTEKQFLEIKLKIETNFKNKQITNFLLKDFVIINLNKHKQFLGFVESLKIY